jgi:hypothetical protein
MTIERTATAEAEETHASSDAARAFTDVLYPLCIEPPTFGRWHSVQELGSQRVS